MSVAARPPAPDVPPDVPSDVPSEAPAAPSRATLRRAALRATLRLALPLVVVQVGLVLMGTVDTIMVGHVSSTALAAVAVGTLYFHGVVAFGQGLLMALDPLVAQAVGAGDTPAVARAVQRGLLLAVAVTVPLAALMLPAPSLLRALGQPAAIVPDAGAYVRASVPGILPFLAFVVLRQSLQAIGHVRAIVVAIVLANVVNAALNWVLVFGHLGAPALGAVGSAWASTVSRWLMAAALAAGAWSRLRPVLRPWRADTLRLAPLARMARLGTPIGLQFVLEYGAFGAIGLLMGTLGTAQVAGHQTAINLASLTFMVPLGVGSAAATLVGHAVGAGDMAQARRSALAAYACGVGFMAASAGVLLAVPDAIATLYTRDAAVHAVAASLIPIAGVFQVFDGLQVVSIGVLRGAGDTRASMVVNALGFWLLGLPLGAWLGFGLGAGPRGLWWGLVAGLAIVGTVLTARAYRLLHAPRARVGVD